MNSGLKVNDSDLQISIKNLPGLIILQHKENKSQDGPGINCCNRILAYYCLNGEPTDVYKFYNNVPTFRLSSKDRRQRKLSYRTHSNVLRCLFAADKDEPAIKLTVGQYSIQTYVDDQQCCLITKARRQDLYHPFAFLQYNKLIGGLQINFKLFTDGNTNDKVLPIQTQPIGSIVTAMCLYGSNLTFTDSYRNTYPVTITADALARDQVIVEVTAKSHQLHPDEKLAYKTIENMIPLFYVLGNGIMPTIYFHLPVAEYIIHGLDLFLSRHMTSNAFHQYANYIIQRGTIHYQWIMQHCLHYNIQLVTETPIMKLVLQNNYEFCLQSFLDRIQVSIDMLNTDQRNINLSALVARQCWTWLCQYQSEPFRSVWKFIMDNKDINCKDSKLFDVNSLQSLKHLSYATHIAAVNSMNHSTRSLLVLPFREKQVSTTYKNMLSTHYGPILGLHWMMPILSNISRNNELYYLEDYLAPLDDLIENNIMSQCFLEIGAAALKLDDETSYSRAKEEILSEHRNVVERRINLSSNLSDN